MLNTRRPRSSLVTAPGRALRLAEFLFRRNDAAGDIYPDDHASGRIDGPDPERLLFLGERGQLDLGIRTHDLSLPAFFARHLNLITGRGVTWSMLPFPQGRLDDAPEVIRNQESALHHADTVVLLVGITDALRVISASTWQQQLTETLDALERQLATDARILISEIPPLDNAGSLSRPARIAAGIHGKALNRHTRDAAHARPWVTVVPFPDDLTNSVWRPESEQARYTNTYKVWGRHLATALPPRHPR